MKETETFNTYVRNAVFSETKNYCHSSQSHDFVEITEWSNGEGFDISMGYDRNFQLTYGEFELLKKMVKTLMKQK